MATHAFDIVVLGGELSGLVAATLCASRGYRVALVGAKRRPDRYKCGAFSLPVEPFALVGLESPAVQRAVDELHFTHLLRRKIKAGGPGFQLVTPDARLDVVADDPALHRELERELGDGAAADLAARAAELARGLDAMLSGDDVIPPASSRRRREHARQLAAESQRASELLGAAPPLVRALLAAPAAATCDLVPAEHNDLVRVRAFDAWRRGTPRIDGDLGGLREILLEKLQSHSGELIDDAPVELSYSWGGKVTGLELRSGDKLGTNQVIAAMPVDELAVLVGAKGMKKIGEPIDLFEPGGYRYTLNLVVDEAGIPEGMGRTVLCVGDLEAPLEGANFLRIQVGEPDDRARVVVSVAAICPAPQEHRTLEEEMADLRVGIREALEMVMPFFSQHLILAHSPHEASPPELRAGGDKPSPPLRALPPRPLWRAGAALEGLGVLPYQVGLKNLTMGSSQVVPTLGLEGEFLVGLGAANLATQGAGKRKPAREVLASR